MKTAQQVADDLVMHAIVKQCFNSHIGRAMASMIELLYQSILDVEKKGDTEIRQKAVDLLLNTAARIENRTKLAQ